MKLREIAHCRAGDKGDTSNIGVFVYDDRDYAYLLQHLTAERVKEAFGELVRGRVIRYEVPKICGLNFVMEQALGGGVTTTLRIDIHGKSLSSLMVDMDLPDRQRR
ncbi:MAG: hypothetical protein ABWZ85_09305 [Luteibacter sp.]